jgi:hypothetical protein
MDKKPETKLTAPCTCFSGGKGYWCDTCLAWHYKIKALEFTNPELAKKLRKYVG